MKEQEEGKQAPWRPVASRVGFSLVGQAQKGWIYRPKKSWLL
jgi:hypothetical protein